MPKKRKEKECKEAVREGRNVNVLLQNMTPTLYEPTPEGALKKRAQLRKDLRERKRKKQELHTESLLIKRQRKATLPRKLTHIARTEFVVHVTKMSLDSIVDEFLPAPQASDDNTLNTKPKSTFPIVVKLMDETNALLETVNLRVSPSMTVERVLSLLAMELEETEIHKDQIDLYIHEKLIGTNQQVKSLGLPQGSTVVAKKKKNTKGNQSPTKRPAKVDPFLESSDEEDQKPQAKMKRIRKKA